MAKFSLSQRDRKRIDAAVSHYVENRELFESFAQALMAYFQNNARLSSFIHFIRYRIKDPDHLREKLVRKAELGDVIDHNSLFDKITDLAGVRIVHLHTDQIREMHGAIQQILSEQQLRLVEEPTANCWDIEYERLFNEFGIATRSRDSMYTTVHYVIQANQRTRVTCEVQLRTLMDEVWAEVSHRVNYPNQSPSRTCQDQLKVLARLTSGCTRLVDSIFRSHLDAAGTSQP
ncbi:MAG: RelA/SpoT domain-containing protein [Pirellulales bacterium]